MQPLLNPFPPMMDTLQNMASASRAVDTVSRDYPDAGLAGSLAPTKRQYRDNNSSTAEIAPAEIPKSNQTWSPAFPPAAGDAEGDILKRGVTAQCSAANL